MVQYYESTHVYGNRTNHREWVRVPNAIFFTPRRFHTCTLIWAFTDAAAAAADRRIIIQTFFYLQYRAKRSSDFLEHWLRQWRWPFGLSLLCRPRETLRVRNTVDDVVSANSDEAEPSLKRLKSQTN